MPTSHPSAIITVGQSLVRINVIFVTYEQVPPELGMWLLAGTHAEKRT
jgi:hypothetical protein